MIKTFKTRNGWAERVASGLFWYLYDQYIEIADSGLVKMYNIKVRGPGIPEKQEPENCVEGKVVRKHSPNSAGDREYELEFDGRHAKTRVNAVELGTGELICEIGVAPKETPTDWSVTSRLYHLEK